MQNSAIEVIELVQINPVPEVQKRHHHILLGREVQWIESSISFNLKIGIILLHQILYYVQMPAVGRVEHRSEPLVVSLVNPIPYLFLVLLLTAPDIRTTQFLQLQRHLPHKRLYQLQMPLVGKLMQHRIALRVHQFQDINIGVVL